MVVVPLGLKYLPETLAPASAAGRAARKAAGKAHGQGAVRLHVPAPRPVPGGQRAVRPGNDRHPVRLVRAGHLAAEPHAAGRLQPGLRPDLRPGPQPGCRGRLGHHGLGRDPLRSDADGHRRGRRRRRRPRGPRHRTVRSPSSTSCWSSPASAPTARSASSSPPSRATIPDTCAEPRWAGRWGRAASAPSPHPRSAASCWPPDWASIPISSPSPVQPPSPRSCWPPSASNSRSKLSISTSSTGASNV